MNAIDEARIVAVSTAGRSRSGGMAKLHGRPNEVADPVPFVGDRVRRPDDADAVGRLFKALVRTGLVLERFRTGFVGEVSPRASVPRCEKPGVDLNDAQ